MGRVFVILAMLFVAGCGGNPADIRDIKLGMQLYQVRELHDRDLTPVAWEKGENADFVQYSGNFKGASEWSNAQRFFGAQAMKGDRKTPYLLTFEIYPPLTAEQCQLLIEKNNVTDPNEIKEIMALEGYQPSKLIQIKRDEQALNRQAIKNAATQSKPTHIQPDHCGGYYVH